MVVTLDELELIRAKARNGDTREEQVIAHVVDVEIRRRRRSGAKPKPLPLTPKERNKEAARRYRKRKKEKAEFNKALKADRERVRAMAAKRLNR